MTHLLAYSVTAPVEVTHTNLTRQKGLAPELPPLAAWLGVERLDTDAIEIFPVSVLGGLDLSDYVRLAFAPEGIDAATQARLDAARGMVLLVPTDAMTGAPAPGPELVEIARLTLARANHDAVLPRAAAAMPAPPAGPRDRDTERTPPIALVALLLMLGFAALVLLVGWRG